MQTSMDRNQGGINSYNENDDVYPNKKNYTLKLCYYGTLIYYEKLWYYGKN